MKRYLTLIVLLCVVGPATQRRTDGAYFNYYAGGFRAFYEVYAEDSSSSDGYYSDTNDSTFSAGVEEYAEVTEAYGYAYNSIWSYAEGDSICIQTQSVADAIADNAIDAGAIATDAITSAEIAASGANKIADHILRRTVQNALDSADGDTKAFRSMIGAVCKLVDRIVASGGTLTIYEDDDTTPLGTQAITTDSGADPITELDTV